MAGKWKATYSLYPCMIHETKTKKLQTENLPLRSNVPRVLIAFISYAEIVTELKGGSFACMHQSQMTQKEKVKVYYLRKWHHAPKRK